MKKLLKLFAFTAAAAMLFSCTINRPQEQTRTITVSGTGTASAKPDLLSLNFLVRTVEWNVNVATEKNAAITTKVIDSIKNNGIDDADISTADYSITQDNSNSYAGRYTVTNTISVLVRNLDNAGKVIDSAVYNGANGLTNFEFRLSDKSSTVRQARTAAVQNAQDAASLLAGASGCKLGSVIEIVEGYSFSGNSSFEALAEAKTAATPISTRSITVTSEITVTYSLTN